MCSPGRGTRLFTVGIATLARRRSAANTITIYFVGMRRKGPPRRRLLHLQRRRRQGIALGVSLSHAGRAPGVRFGRGGRSMTNFQLITQNAITLDDFISAVVDGALEAKGSGWRFLTVERVVRARERGRMYLPTRSDYRAVEKVGRGRRIKNISR